MGDDLDDSLADALDSLSVDGKWPFCVNFLYGFKIQRHDQYF